MNESFRKVGLATSITVGAVLVGLGGSSIDNVVTNPDHSKDVAALTKYTSPEGNDARCNTTLALDFQRSLHEATDGKMSDETAKAFAPVLANMGVKDMHGNPLGPEDLKDITAADLSEVPGFDCDAKGGASTFVVVDTIKEKAPLVIGGLALILGGVSYGLGVRSGRKSSEKEVK